MNHSSECHRTFRKTIWTVRRVLERILFPTKWSKSNSWTHWLHDASFTFDWHHQQNNNLVLLQFSQKFLTRHPAPLTQYSKKFKKSAYIASGSLFECIVVLAAAIHNNRWPQVSWIWFYYLVYSYYTGILFQFERRFLKSL